MAEYKKKKIKRHLFRKKKHTHLENKAEPSRIDKSSTKEKVNDEPKDEIKVIKGSKLRRKRQLRIFACIICVFVSFALILSMALPGGLYENAVNFFATLGSGSYPISISGGTIVNVSANGSHYYVLTDTNIAAYSTSGKIVFDEMHGFENPIISVAGTRALLFDQGGKDLYIYNLSGKLHTLTLEDNIINASISEEGEFAVATHSKSNASVVKVYDSDFEEIYVWNSYNDIINNVLVNTDGDQLAISSFEVISGEYVSKVMIFEFDSADAVYTINYSNSLVIDIENTGDGMSIITNNKYEYLHWSDFNNSNLSFSSEINSFQSNSDGVLLTINRANDRSDNTIVLISEEGNKISEFKIDSTITDIKYYDGRIYALCDTQIRIYDQNGKILRSSNCNYGTHKIIVLSSDAVAAISDIEISRLEIKEGDD